MLRFIQTRFFKGWTRSYQRVHGNLKNRLFRPSVVWGRCFLRFRALCTPEKVFKKLNFPKIDFVIVNFYPFSKISNKEDSSKKIEMIDIGGPAIIRSASKTFESVTTISE